MGEKYQTPEDVNCTGHYIGNWTLEAGGFE